MQRNEQTGLLDRDGLLQVIGVLPSANRRHEHHLACLHVGLGGVEDVAANAGPDAVDLVLRTVVQRLLRSRRENDTVARVGPAAFVMLLRISAETGFDEAATVAARLLRTITEPIVAEGHTVRLGCSIGIAIWPEDAQTATALLDMAAEAFEEAHRQGDNQSAFHPSREAAAQEKNGE